MELCSQCEKGNREKVLKILNKSCDVINKLAGSHRVLKTPIQHACEYGHWDIVQDLIKYGADLNIKSSDGRTCLHYACLGGHPQLLEFLIGQFEDVNQTDINGQTALHLACYHGECDCASVLINLKNNNQPHTQSSIKCELSLRDKSGKTCCEVAVMSDQSDILKLFMKNDADDCIKQINVVNGESILHVICKYNAIKCLSILMKSRGLFTSINIVDSKGMLPCHHAAHHGNVDVLQLLLQDKTFMHVGDNNGRTVGHYSSLSGSVSCIHWLLGNNINTSLVDVNRNTLMHYAGKSSSCGELVNCLANHGVTFDTENTNGETPLDKARQYGHPVAFQSGLNGQVKCKICLESRTRKIKPAVLNKNIQSHKSFLFSAVKI